MPRRQNLSGLVVCTDQAEEEQSPALLLSSIYGCLPLKPQSWATVTETLRSTKSIPYRAPPSTEKVCCLLCHTSLSYDLEKKRKLRDFSNYTHTQKKKGEGESENELANTRREKSVNIHWKVSLLCYPPPPKRTREVQILGFPSSHALPTSICTICLLLILYATCKMYPPMGIHYETWIGCKKPEYWALHLVCFFPIHIYNKVSHFHLNKHIPLLFGKFKLSASLLLDLGPLQSPTGVT